MFEEQETAQLHVPDWFVPRTLTTGHMFEEMARPTGRFRSPLSFRERMTFRLNRFFLKFSITRDIPLSLAGSLPLNWQILLNYLYRKGVAERPSVHFVKARSDKPKIFNFFIKAHFDRARTDAYEYSFGGFASGFEAEQTIPKAIGELLERYAGSVYKYSSFLKASIKEMRQRGLSFLNPSVLCQYEDWQKEGFPSLKYTEDTAFSWVSGTELTTGKQAYMPAQLAYWLRARSEINEPTLYPITSNGSAGHFTRSEALVAAIREYIERDAFLVHWLNTISPKRIDVESWEDEEVKNLLAYLKRYNVSAYWLDTQVDMPIPSSLCLLIQDEEGASLAALGAATGANAKESFLKSFSEAISALNRMDSLTDVQTVTFGGKYVPFTDKKINQDVRAYIWRGPEMYKRIQFLTAGPHEKVAEFEGRFKQFASAEEELATLLESLKKKGKGYEVYAYEMQHPVLRKLGYHVAKVVIPALLPLYLHEHLVPLAATRLVEGPKGLGTREPVRNIYPHPFP